MKICRQCGIEKPIEDYYKHKDMPDGHLNKCKECVKENVRNHRALNIDKVRAYDRARGQTKKRKDKNKEYQDRMKIESPEKWRSMRREATRKYRKNHHERFIAKSRITYAKRTGKIKQEPCEICGALKVEAHHPDYTKPLEVVWLCDYHHKEEHKRLRAQERGEL